MLLLGFLSMEFGGELLLGPVSQCLFEELAGLAAFGPGKSFGFKVGLPVGSTTINPIADWIDTAMMGSLWRLVAL
jgi:hypothetical protein